MRDALDDIRVLRAVLDGSPDFVAIADAGGRVLYVNPSGLALMGLTELALAPTPTIDELFVGAGTGIDGGTPSALEYPAREWQGLSEVKNFATNRPIPVEVTSFVVPRPGGQSSVTVSMARDSRTAHDDHDLCQAAVKASTYWAAEQQAVAELSRLALDGEIDQLLDAATTAASTLTGADRCMITRPIEGDPDKVAVVGFTGQPPRLVTAPAGHESLMGYTMMANDVVLCHDRDEETRFSTAAMASFGFRSGVGVPIPGGESGCRYTATTTGSTTIENCPFYGRSPACCRQPSAASTWTSSCTIAAFGIP